MKRNTCLAAAQSISVPGDLAANIERHCAFVRVAATAGRSAFWSAELLTP